MHNSAPVLENDSHKLLWDVNLQTDHLIPARIPDLIIIKRPGGLGSWRTCRDYQTTAFLRTARILRRVLET